MKKKVIVKSICAAACLWALAACSHSYQFRHDWNQDALKTHALSGKKFAFDLSGVEDTYHDKAGGHTFEMTGVRAATLILLKKMFANDQVVENPADAEYVLKLHLDLKIKSSLQNSCTASAHWDVVKDGAIVSMGNSSVRKVMAFMKLQGMNCEVAVLNAYPDALDSAFSKLPNP